MKHLSEVTDRQRIFREWRIRGTFESTKQWLFDQVRAIRTNGWLSELELEVIKRKIEDEAQSEDDRLEEEARIKIVDDRAEEDNNDQAVDADVRRDNAEMMNKAENNNNELDQGQRLLVVQVR